MTIVHHVGDDLLVSYAAGALSEGWSIAVATHLALCPDCRQRSLAAEALGGSMLEGLEGQAPDVGSWATVRAKLTAVTAETSQQPPTKPQTLPRPLRDYVGSDLDGVRWQMLGKGASQLRIRTADRSTQVRLLRIPAGKPVPEHTHGGRELTLVLAGAFYDGETVFARGDIEDADASLTHTPTATPEADCICLAVTDAPLRFSSWIVRLVQPILGI